MGVSKNNVVVRNIRVMTTEEGIAVLLDITFNIDARKVFSETYNKIMIYRCKPVDSNKYKCELIKDWGVWENYQLISTHRDFESNTLCATLSIELPNVVVNRLAPMLSGYVPGIKVVTKLIGYVLYNNKTWDEIHAKLKKRVLVTEKTVEKRGV